MAVVILLELRELVWDFAGISACVTYPTTLYLLRSRLMLILESEVMAANPFNFPSVLG